MKEGLVTVVITAYNSEKFIEKAIDSVFGQTYKNIELIVVDDHSTDRTLEIVKQYGDRLIIKTQEHGGLPAISRNTGIENIKGEFVAYLDHDDHWLPDKIESGIIAFKKFPEAGFLFSDLNRFEHKTGKFYAFTSTQIYPSILQFTRGKFYENVKAFQIDKKEMFELLLQGYPLFPSTMMMKSSLIEQVGEWSTIDFSEDYDYGLRCAFITDFIYVDDQLSNIGRHETNRSYELLLQDERDIGVMTHHQSLPRYNKKEKEIIQYYNAKKMCGLGYSLLKQGENKAARRWYLKAAKHKKLRLHAFLRYLSSYFR